MRIRYLREIPALPAPIAVGAEFDVMPGRGARLIEEGIAAEVLPGGKLRRRRGRPSGAGGKVKKRAKEFARKLATLGGAGDGPGSEPEPAPLSDSDALELSPDARG